MGEKYNPATQPFHTTNAILAFCLHLAGVPWEDNRKAVKVFYSADILKRFVTGASDPVYQGWELEKAVEHAHKNGRRGHVEYVFKRVPRIKKLIEAFHDQEEQFDDSTNRESQEVIEAVMTSDVQPDIKMVKVACVVLKTRVPFMELWKYQVPLVMMPNKGRVKRRTVMANTRHGLREVTEVTHPGYKIVSTNASEQTRKDMGL